MAHLHLRFIKSLFAFAFVESSLPSLAHGRNDCGPFVGSSSKLMCSIRANRMAKLAMNINAGVLAAIFLDCFPVSQRIRDRLALRAIDCEGSFAVLVKRVFRQFIC